MVNMDDSETFRPVDVGRRPPTEELVELHIYVVPSEKWIEKRKLAKRDIIDYAISSGFVRVLPSTTLSQLRMDIHEQLGYEYVPDVFVFLRSIGRNFTQVKPRQERELKVRSFTPPYAEEPEIYVKEGEYVAVRSASLGAEVPVSEVASIPHPDISFTSAEMAIESSGPDILNLESTPDKRSQSLDRADHRNTQIVQRAGRAPAPGSRVIFKGPSTRAPRVPGQYKNTRGRPPTPRVKERPLGNLGKHRVAPVSVKRGKEDSIKEIPKESTEEDSQQQNHFMEIKQESEVELESSPPQPEDDTEEVEADSSSLEPANESEVEKMRLLYEELRAERRLRELKRDALMQKARDLQRRKATTRDQVREEWRKRYMEVKKLSPRLEDHCTKLRQELERLVREMLVKVRTTETEAKPHKPSKKTSYKIMIMRLLQEVEDLRRRLQSATIRLNAETKLRDQAEYEVKKLRQDLLQKKTQVTLTRKHAAFARPSQPFFISAV